MKKIFIGLFVFLSALILPLTNADAATYRMKRMPLNGFITVYPSGMYVNGIKMQIGSHGGFRTLEVHVVEDGPNIYQGYCLHLAKQIYNNATLEYHEGFGDLVDSNGQVLDATRQEVLKNILASGYQNGNRSVDNFVGGNYHVTGQSDVGTCENNEICVNVLATQLLVWEVQANARRDYSTDPKGNAPYNRFVNENSSLRSAYTRILNEAYSLTQNDNVPSLGQTYTLRWNDNINRYMSDYINIGNYNVVRPVATGLEVEGKNSNNQVRVYSNEEITTSKKVDVRLIKGQTTEGSTSFRWFRFVNHSDAQDVLMGDYSVVLNNSFDVKTEVGKFKISKVDSETKNLLKGSKFNLYKCSGSNCSSKEFLQEIDLIKNPQTVEVTIKKSGTYLFEETVVPYGYNGLGQFMVDFSIDTAGNAIITNIYTNSANIQLIDGTPIKNSLVVENEAKEVIINKVDATDEKNLRPLHGATFQVKDKGGNLVKFELVNGTYRYSTNGTITDLVDPTKSQYSISLLPAGEYTIIETAVPYPYVLAGNTADRQTKIKVDKNSDLWVWNYTTKSYNKSTNATVTIKNFRTLLVITKIGTKATALKNVKFELYDSTKTKQIVLNKNAANEYEYSKDQNGVPIQIITNDKGKAVIRYLPAGKYWLKETVTTDGYVVDETNEWTQIEIKVGRDSAPRVDKTITNAKNEFSFFKVDEDGNYLNDGKFKLQVYNEKTSKYEDASLIYHEKDDVYTIDKTGESDIYIFTPINGIVTFKDVDSKTRYRIVEIEAPEGFVLPKASEAQVELYINENGYAIGDTILINKKITVEEQASAQAELVINISTGQQRIRYVFIIFVLLTAIIGLFIINRKLKK